MRRLSPKMVIVEINTLKRDIYYYRNVSRFPVQTIRSLENPVRIDLLSDLELLIALCASQKDDLLYSEFVSRFLSELEVECINICRRRKLDLHIGRQIAHEAFEKLRKYKSFDSSKLTHASSHKGILIYLYQISRNLFNDWHNKEKRKKGDYRDRSYFEQLTEKVDIPNTPQDLKWKKDIAVKIFSKLNKKEQTVVLADIDYKKFSRYLPDDITVNLALELKVKKGTIRKIRERAILKIKKAIDEINHE